MKVLMFYSQNVLLNKQIIKQINKEITYQSQQCRENWTWLHAQILQISHYSPNQIHSVH